MRRLAIAVAAVALVVAGCGWSQHGFDSGGSNTNGLETTLTTANIGHVVDHTFATGLGYGTYDVLTTADLILVYHANTNQLVAYDRHTCPHTDNSACTPLWTTTAYQPTSDGVLIYFASGHTVRVVDQSGALVRTDDVGGVDPVVEVRLSDHYVLATVAHPVGEHDASARYAVFARAGCGATVCAPVSSLALHTNICCPYNSAIIGDRVYTTDVGDDTVLTGRDIATGAIRWRSTSSGGPEFNNVRARGTTLYTDSQGGEIRVYDAGGVAGCSGNPPTCAPIRKIPAQGTTLSITDRTVVERETANGLPPQPDTLRFYPATAAGCSGSPSTCPAFASSVTLSSPGGSAAATGSLAFVIDSVQSPIFRYYHLYAFDADAQVGCNGTPKVCTPLLDLGVGSDPAYGVTVWDGRIYVPVESGVIHVIGLRSSFS